MKSYARIQSNIVSEVIGVADDQDITAMFHPSLVWVACDSSVQQGWSYDGTTFTAPAAPAPPSLDELKTAAQGQLLTNVNRFIETLPNGFVRYDTNLKLNMIVYGVQNEPAKTAHTWIQAVQVAYFGLKAEIQAAADQVALEAMDISYDWFEARYGVNGSVLPDPDVSTGDLLG